MKIRSSCYTNSFSMNKILNSELSTNEKLSTVASSLQYYFKLKIGEITRQIYHIGEKNITEISKNNFLGSNMIKFDMAIRNFIKKNSTSVPNILDPSKNLGFEHVGFGAFLVKKFYNSLLLTQGKATFYFYTPIKKNIVFSITLQSIAKISGSIFFEDKKSLEFHLPSLKQRTFLIQIDKNDLVDVVSKIAVATNEFWSPHYIDNDLYDIPVGVGIKRIILSDHINDLHSDSNS